MSDWTVAELVEELKSAPGLYSGRDGRRHRGRYASALTPPLRGEGSQELGEAVLR